MGIVVMFLETGLRIIKRAGTVAEVIVGSWCSVAFDSDSGFPGGQAADKLSALAANNYYMDPLGMSSVRLRHSLQL